VPVEGRVAVLLQHRDRLLLPDRPYAPQRRKAFHLRLVGEENGRLRPNASDPFGPSGKALLYLLYKLVTMEVPFISRRVDDGLDCHNLGSWEI
jgi:hypothetical protein